MLITRAVSIDHLVGGGLQRQWHRKAERLGCLEVDHQLEFRGQSEAFDGLTNWP
jgi:hypothetical protein